MKYLVTLTLWNDTEDQTGYKINTIKALRDVAGTGLKDTKDFVDAYTKPVRVRMTAEQIVQCMWGKWGVNKDKYYCDIIGLTDVEEEGHSDIIDFTKV